MNDVQQNGLPVDTTARYFFLKLGKQNILLDQCLRSDRTNPYAVVFYGRGSWADILGSNECDQQFRDYVDVGAKAASARTTIVVSGWGHMWFYHPAGPVEDGAADPIKYHTEDPPKILRLRPAVRARPWDSVDEPVVNLANVPAVLAGLRASRHLSSGTFRPITQPGNVAALETVLFGHLESGTFAKLIGNGLAGLLRCLGSIELETLVARLLEESGLFVPAFHGGTIPDIDVFVRNDTASDIDVGGVRFPSGTRNGIQVKGVSDRTHTKGAEDFRICLAPQSNGPILGVPWFADCLRVLPKTRGWLRRSLNWLPPEIVDAHLSA